MNYREKYTNYFVKKIIHSEKHIKKAVVEYFPTIDVNSLFLDFKRELESNKNTIPYIGINNPMTIFLLPTVRAFFIYKAFANNNVGIELIGKLLYRISENEVNSIPLLIRKIAGILWFSTLFRARVRKRAIESKSKRFDTGYVFDYTDLGKKGYSVTYRECASWKYLCDNGSKELAPYVCAIDKLMSEKLGWGLTRTKTLANGADMCDFDFLKGGGTFVN